MLGLAHTLSVANQAKLASQLKVVKEAGLGPGLGIYRQVERVGNVVAPIILGVLASYMGYAKSLALIGIYTAISSLLFLLIYKEESSQENQHRSKKFKELTNLS
jgi:dipeptide/tripeptide permease